MGFDYTKDYEQSEFSKKMCAVLRELSIQGAKPPFASPQDEAHALRNLLDKFSSWCAEYVEGGYLCTASNKEFNIMYEMTVKNSKPIPRETLGR